jgi:hypothetical protein
MGSGSGAIQAWTNVRWYPDSGIRWRGAHCLTLFRFGKRQGSGNSKNATALRHVDNANGAGGVSPAPAPVVLRRQHSREAIGESYHDAAAGRRRMPAPAARLCAAAPKA